MATELEGLLRALHADPSKLGALTAEQERDLVVGLRTVASGTTPVTLSTGKPAPAWSEGDLMTVDEAAAMLRVSKRWLYRHAPTLPFARKLSPKVLRFSRAGIIRWLAVR